MRVPAISAGNKSHIIVMNNNAWLYSTCLLRALAIDLAMLVLPTPKI